MKPATTVLSESHDTPFGAILGVKTVIENSGRPSSLTLIVRPSPEHVNHRGTVHGGFIQAVFDEAVAQLVANWLHPGAAVTTRATVNFVRSARPKHELRFAVRIITRTDSVLHIAGVATAGSHTVADYLSQWLVRSPRARSS